MRRSLVVGAAAGIAFAAWSTLTMFWPVSYRVWDLGRSAVFVAFILALAALAARAARSGATLGVTIGAVGLAVAIAGAITLAIDAAVTGMLADRIVQLPEHAFDYAHHDYASPAEYLKGTYRALLELQLFSWAVGGVMLVGLASVAGWLLRGIGHAKAA